VTLTRDQAQGGLTRVTQNVGAGFAAVRYIPPAPVDLRQTPVLELPLRLSPTAAVNLHLFIGGRSYVVEVAAPVSGMKSLLTPRFEQGECFQLPTLSEFAVKGNRYLGQATPKDGMLRIDLMDQAKRLVVGLSEPMVQAITVGNTSNTGYLLAGNGGKNLAGSSYWLGVPTFCPQ
jgi:hypothetical protein